MAQLQIAPFGRTSRTPRRPQHTFAIATRPWCITPFFIAPVLPGETLKNLLCQARIVTDPIKNPLIGWWAELYFFYVKHRDMVDRDVLTQMMIDPAVSAPVQGAQNAPNYRFAGGVSWASMCNQRVVECYFRDDGELWTDAQFGGFMSAQISQRTALDSALLDAAYTAGAPGLVVGADDTITGQEIDQTWVLWQQYRANNLTNLSYEEYLATYGIPLPAGSDSMHRPELIRYVKDWSYPVNTVDPLTGTPSSAVSWALAERADKDRFFREPGFIYGVCVMRPKVYLANQTGSVSGALKDALAWLPAVLGDNPEYSVRKFTALTGPFPKCTTDYRVDLKDLFLYGEQYTNLGQADNTLVPGVANSVVLPSPAMQKKYPSSTDADSLFKTPTTNQIRIDGVVSLNILGMQVDTSPTQAPGGF